MCTLEYVWVLCDTYIGINVKDIRRLVKPSQHLTYNNMCLIIMPTHIYPTVADTTIIQILKLSQTTSYYYNSIYKVLYKFWRHRGG